MGPAFWTKRGSRGKIQVRCRQGQSASWAPGTAEAIARLSHPASRALAQQYVAENWSAALIGQEIALVAAWARGHGVRVVANEFGVMRETAPPDSRRRWLRDARTMLERHGLGWTMWDYMGGFNLVTERAGVRTADEGVLRALGLLPWTDPEPSPPARLPAFHPLVPVPNVPAGAPAAWNRPPACSADPPHSAAGTVPHPPLAPTGAKVP